MFGIPRIERDIDSEEKENQQSLWEQSLENQEGIQNICWQKQ